jgi:hypothetical protein
MPVIKINRKVFGDYYGYYDISHDVTGSLILSSRTTVFLDTGVLQGPGDYKLFTYPSLSLLNDLTVRSAINVSSSNPIYEGYAVASGNAIYAKVYNTSAIIKDHVQTIDNGILVIDGPTTIELDSSLFSAAGKYALFDYRLGDLSGDLANIEVVMSGSTSLTPSAPYIEGPYIVTTLS